jgi:glycosyltransferase involved in cell wall biosynthesis
MTAVVSIVLLAYKRPQYLGRAIGSAQRQTLQNWELIVVQDGDDAEVSRVIAGFAQNDRRIRHLRRLQPGNIADATNYALSEARTELIAILDDDDEWADDTKLALQVNFFRAHPDHVGCGGGVIVVNGAGEEMMRYGKPRTDEEIRRVALVANPIAHSSAMFRKAAAFRVGGYDATELSDFQDWDFWLKLGQVGKLANLEPYLLRYTMWAQGASAARQRSTARSAIKILHRHKGRYPRFLSAWFMVYSYYIYAQLPYAVRQSIFLRASMAKKRLFSPRHLPSTPVI